MRSTRFINFDRYDTLLAFLCFAGGFVLYLRTLTPGLLPGDSGEFQTLAYLLGHTHPTGYPVYLVLAKMATFLPIGDVAYRVNLFSAIMGALTVAMVYLAGRLLVNYRILAFVGVAIFTLSPTFWSQAVIAEIYTAGAAFLAIILFLLFWWDREDSAWMLFVAGLLGGLSLGVHMSVALLAPAVLIFLLLHWNRGAKMWKPALLGAMSGVILTLFIFWLIDMNNPTANYFNSIVEPSRSAWRLGADDIDGTLERLFFGWSARQFRSFMFTDVASIMMSQAGDFWDNLPNELSWLFVVFAAAGVISLLIHRWRVGILLASALGLQLLFFFNYEIWDLYVFYIPSYVLLTLLAISGMGAIVDAITKVLGKILAIRQMKWVNYGLVVAVTLVVLVFALWPVFQPQKDAVIAGDVPFDLDEFPVYNDNLQNFAVAVVVNMPENAILFTDWDSVWPYYYAAHILEERDDLTFVETYPADDVSGVAYSVVDYVEINIENHPIFFEEREPVLERSGFEFTPIRIGPRRLFKLILIN